MYLSHTRQDVMLQSMVQSVKTSRILKTLNNSMRYKNIYEVRYGDPPVYSVKCNVIDNLCIY